MDNWTCRYSETVFVPVSLPIILVNDRCVFCTDNINPTCTQYDYIDFYKVWITFQREMYSYRIDDWYQAAGGSNSELVPHYQLRYCPYFPCRLAILSLLIHRTKFRSKQSAIFFSTIAMRSFFCLLTYQSYIIWGFVADWYDLFGSIRVLCRRSIVGITSSSSDIVQDGKALKWRILPVYFVRDKFSILIWIDNYVKESVIEKARSVPGTDNDIVFINLE